MHTKIYFIIIIFFSYNITADHIFSPKGTQANKLAIFFDGTGQDEDNYTNIQAIYHHTTLQKAGDIHTAYFAGLGTDQFSLLSEALLGIGLSKNVKKSYLFLLNQHQADVGIFIFGFSRGAYQARVLSGLIHVMGFPEWLKELPIDKQESIVNLAIETFHGGQKAINLREELSKKINNHYPKIKRRISKSDFSSIPIDFLGLFDTVSAFQGKSLFVEDTKEVDAHFYLQLCNIKHAAHAVSLDDTRPTFFSPLLLESKHLLNDCPNHQPDIQEVFFSGGHSNIGGGIKRNYLSMIPLNWMLSELKPYNLVTVDHLYDPIRFEQVHTERLKWMMPCYYKPRDIAKYKKNIKLHISVFIFLKHKFKALKEAKEMETTEKKEEIIKENCEWLYKKNKFSDFLDACINNANETSFKAITVIKNKQ